jgi:hypothetical protein
MCKCVQFIYIRCLLLQQQTQSGSQIQNSIQHGTENPRTVVLHLLHLCLMVCFANSNLKAKGARCDSTWVAKLLG